MAAFAEGAPHKKIDRIVWSCCPLDTIGDLIIADHVVDAVRAKDIAAAGAAGENMSFCPQKFPRSQGADNDLIEFRLSILSETSPKPLRHTIRAEMPYGLEKIRAT